MGQTPIGYEDVLRRLTINDERYVSSILSAPAATALEALDQRTEELVRLAALIALDAGDAAIHARVAAALASGASRDDVVDVLLAVAPTVGSARIVGLAPRIAEAIGFDVFGALEASGQEGQPDTRRPPGHARRSSVVRSLPSRGQVR